MVVLISLSSQAFAAEYKIVGAVEKIVLADSTANVTVKDEKTRKKIIMLVNDYLTLDKIKSGRIRVGDEIRCKYDDTSGKNVVTKMIRTGGC